jgi:hypothetical protein
MAFSPFRVPGHCAVVVFVGDSALLFDGLRGNQRVGASLIRLKLPRRFEERAAITASEAFPLDEGAFLLTAGKTILFHDHFSVSIRSMMDFTSLTLVTT